jgi:AcrR family transcriptional regulator
MGRWEPDPRGRLVRAALELYAERGFDGATAPEIAERAGLHERSFFRLFPDKREVLFAGADATRAILTSTIETNAIGTPLERAARAVEAMCAKFQSESDIVRQRNAIIDANPELAERNLAKHAEFAGAMTDALAAQGVPVPAARLASETGMAVFLVAFDSWIEAFGNPDLPTVYRDTFRELTAAVAGSEF